MDLTPGHVDAAPPGRDRVDRLRQRFDRRGRIGETARRRSRFGDGPLRSKRLPSGAGVEPPPHLEEDAPALVGVGGVVPLFEQGGRLMNFGVRRRCRRAEQVGFDPLGEQHPGAVFELEHVLQRQLAARRADQVRAELAPEAQAGRLDVRRVVCRVERRQQVGEVRRRVLLMDVAARRVLDLGQRIVRHQLRPDLPARRDRDDRGIAAGGMWQRRQRPVPDVEDVPRSVRIGEVGARPRPHRHRGLPLGEGLGVHHPEELLAAAVLSGARRFEDERLTTGALHHRPERRGPAPTGFRRESGPVPILDRHVDGFERHRAVIDQDVVDQSRRERHRVELVRIHVVVGRGPAEVPIEAADHAERTPDPEVAVEVEATRHHDVRLVVPGGPRQVRIAKQDCPARRRPARRHGPGVGAVDRPFPACWEATGSLAGGTAGPGPAARSRSAERSLHQPPGSHGVAAAAHFAGQYVPPGKIGLDRGVEAAPVGADEMVDRRGKAVVDVLRRPFQRRPAADSLGVDRSPSEVAVEAVATEGSAHLAATADQAVYHAGAIVFRLDPAESVAGGPEIVRIDVRHAVRGPNDLRLGCRSLGVESGSIGSAPGCQRESDETGTAHTGPPWGVRSDQATPSPLDGGTGQALRSGEVIENTPLTWPGYVESESMLALKRASIHAGRPPRVSERICYGRKAEFR